MPAHLRAIYVKRFKKGPMDPRAAATLVTGKGIAGNANQGGRRQVVLLTEEGWREATAELGVDLDPTARRGNLLLSGVDLENTRGRLLRIGPVLLRIWTECTPCYQMDQAHSGLQRALRPHWRAGACAQVLAGGEIRVGDAAVWEEEAQQALPCKIHHRTKE
ncbi:MAG TPA: MOSC domain-containing protein [Thermoanaerobaculia bacterium]|nr:MOSC domain-containing protein [Thermoanaerobaculia bacterium]